MEIISNRIRKNSLLSIYHAESGHPGGVLSSIDIIAFLFMKEMKYDPRDFSIKERDRFILSKGHCAPALYAVAAEVGILEKYQIGSPTFLH